MLEAEVHAYENNINREMTYLAVFTASIGACVSHLSAWLLTTMPEDVTKLALFYAIGGLLIVCALVSGALWQLERRSRPSLMNVQR